MNKLVIRTGIMVMLFAMPGINRPVFAGTLHDEQEVSCIPVWHNPMAVSYSPVLRLYDPIPVSMEDLVDNMLKEYFEKNETETETIETPRITEAVYRHGRAFYDKTRLQVRWEKMENIDYYEIKITKTDGTTKIYKKTGESLLVYEGSDEFVQECLRSGNVQIRVCDQNGNVSAWSEKEIISCNSLHPRS